MRDDGPDPRNDYRFRQRKERAFAQSFGESFGWSLGDMCAKMIPALLFVALLGGAILWAFSSTRKPKSEPSTPVVVEEPAAPPAPEVRGPAVAPPVAPVVAIVPRHGVNAVGAEMVAQIEKERAAIEFAAKVEAERIRLLEAAKERADMEAAALAAAEKEKREREAAASLKLCKTLLADGKKAAALERLSELARKYPDTAAGKEAAGLVK